MDINISNSGCSSPIDSAGQMLIKNNPKIQSIISGHCISALECFQNNASAAKMVDIRMKNSKSISDIIGISSSSTDTTTTTQDMLVNTDEVSSNNGQNLLVNAEDIAMGLLQIISSHRDESLSMFKTSTPASQMMTLRMKNLSSLKELAGSLPLSVVVLQEQLVNAEEEAIKLFEKDLLRGNNSFFVDKEVEKIVGNDIVSPPQQEGNNKNNVTNKAPGTSDTMAKSSAPPSASSHNTKQGRESNGQFSTKKRPESPTVGDSGTVGSSPQNFNIWRGSNWSKSAEYFTSQISYNNIGRPLGYYQLSSDAARAYDKATMLLRDPGYKLNFATSEEYISMRRLEIKERKLDSVVDLDEMSAIIDSNVNGIVSKIKGKSFLLATKNKDFNLLKGINWTDKGVGSYTSQISCNTIGRSLGQYQLATDAAYARDKAARLLRGPGCNVNFATSQEYISMRNLEIQERKLDMVDLDEMLETIDSKVNEVVSKMKEAAAKRAAKAEDEMIGEDTHRSGRKRTQPKPFVPNQRQTMGGKKATATSTTSSSGFTINQMEQMYNGKRVVDMTDDELRAQAKDHPEGMRVVDVLGRDKLIAACASREQRPAYSSLTYLTQDVSYTERIRINLANCLEGKKFMPRVPRVSKLGTKWCQKEGTGKAEDEMVVDESEEDIRRSGRKRVQPKPFVAYRGQDSAYSRAGSSAIKHKKMVSHVLFQGKIESVGKDKSPPNSASKKGTLVPNNPAPVPHNPISLWEQAPSLDRELAWLVEETVLIMPTKETDTTSKLELPVALELALVHGSNELHRALSASFPTEVKSMLKSMKNFSPIVAGGMKLKQLTGEVERGDRVYGAWWQEGVNRSTTPPSYYPGTIDSYNAVGMDRFYSVLFDDGEESHNLKASHIVVVDEEASKLVLVEGQHLRNGSNLESSIFESLREDAGKALLLSYRRSDSLGMMMELLKESGNDISKRNQRQKISANKNSALTCSDNNKDSKQQEGRVTISVVRPSKEVELGLGVEKRDDRMVVTSIAPGIFDGSQLDVGMTIDSVNGNSPLSYKDAMHTLQNAEGMINIVALSSIIGGMSKRQPPVNPASQQHFPTKQNLSSYLTDITNSPPRKKKKKMVSNVVSNDQKRNHMSTDTSTVALFSTTDYDRIFPAC